MIGIGEMARMRERDRRRAGIDKESLLTRSVTAVFEFVRLAEFEILFFLFFFVAFLIFKDLVSISSFQFDQLPWLICRDDVVG